MKKKRVVILSNHHSYTYNFRKEIIQELLDRGCEVCVVLPYGEKVEDLKKMGCKFIDVPLDRRGKNPFKELQLFIRYLSILSHHKPDVVLTYTIKPNLYGGFLCRIKNIPYIANITGLSSAVEGKKIAELIYSYFYRIAFKKINCIFCQNQENLNYFVERNISSAKIRLIPGSGVNVTEFYPLTYPEEDKVRFMYISRIMKQKGIDNYLEAAKFIKKKYTYTEFHVLGFCEESYQAKLRDYEKKGIISYHGMQDDVKKYHKISHCTIHPTYYPEGMSNVLLESAACARPIITTDWSGCREIVENNINGFIIKQQNTEDLIQKIEQFLMLDHESKIKMGLEGRCKIEREFDRNIIVNSYIEEILKISKI